MGAVFSQSLFIPKPTITERNCPDQTARVFMVTGGYAGIGYELCRILYDRNATVYIAGRSRDKASEAMDKIRKTSPNSSGRLEFLAMDFTDLGSVKTGAEAFLAHNDRLDVLVNNAGILLKTDPRCNTIHNTTNCIGPSLLYRLLLPTLTQTASVSPTGSVRVLWAASMAVHAQCPQPEGMHIDESGRPKDQPPLLSYGQTKVGNVFLSSIYARDTPENGIVHAAFNPGNLNSELQRDWKGLDMALMKRLLFFPAVYGAYTELWASVAPDLTPDRSGAYVYPWGRFGSLPAGIEASLKDGEGRGSGVARKFVEWCEAQIEQYL